MKAALVWSRIREPYLYGDRVTCGNVTAECVRCYAGEWTVFCYIAGVMQRHVSPAGRLSYFTARNLAAAFVRAACQAKEKENAV